MLASGLVGLAFSYRDTRSLVYELHREKAGIAATRIELYLRTIERHMHAALLTSAITHEDALLEDRHQELVKLLRIESAIVEVAWIDALGVERLRLSRIAADVLHGTRGRDGDPLIVAARARGAAFGAVHFRQQTEPYLSIAVVGSEPRGGVLVAEVNLKFVWDVVSAMRVGAAGYAYVVDGQGRLISHPDISLVLKRTDLSELPQVQAALSGARSVADAVQVSGTAADGRARPSLAAWMAVPAPGWFVYVEEPVQDAFAPLYATVARTAVVLVVALALCVALSIALARHMTAPIRALQSGAARFGEGRLEERVSVTTGDELETLAHEFNTMAGRLHESRSDLERKIDDRTRALAEANSAKSRFLAVASHDLRQPVHALGLYVAQARQASGGDAREALLGRIEASWQSISSLLDALFDISKLDSDAVQLHRSNFAVQSVLDRIEQSFSVLAQAKGLRMRVRPSGLILASDPAHVERILLNLVSNACRFTHDGGVLVGVRRRGTHARIEVRDTGPGIADDEAPRVFDEFYRVGAGGGESTGMGLGLAIVRRLAQLIDVPIALRSKKGKGSVFSILVPLAPAGSTPDGQAAGAAMDFGLPPGRAMVIDDDMQARDAASGLIRQWGWRVTSAAGGDEALAALAAEGCAPDVIVSDYHLVQETGIDAIEKIRAVYGRSIPAVLVSADATAELRDHAGRLALHLLHKPLQAAKLRAILHHLHGTDPVR